MNGRRRALLLVGSPKAPRSTSEALGTYLLDRLQERGLEVERLRVHVALRSPDGQSGLLAAIDAADVVILSFPLYVDSLPAAVIRALELIAGHRRAAPEPRKAQFVAMVNSGFPEAHQCDTALAICRRFAREAGLDWAGGLPVGAGQAIEGRPLTDLGPMVLNQRKALDLAAGALAAGRPVPPEAEATTARPGIPAWLCSWIAGRGWLRQARKYGVEKRLDEQPYRRPQDAPAPPRQDRPGSR